MKNLNQKLICIAVCAACLLTGCTRGGEPEPEAAPAETTAVTEETTAETTETTVETETVTTEKTERTTAASTAAETAAAETTKAPETIAVPETAQEQKSYSDDELITLARYYYGSRTNHIPQFIDVDTEQNGIVSLHLYDLFDGHTATAAWYYVDRKTAAGRDIMDHLINLNDPEGSLWNPEVTLRREFGDGDFCAVQYLGNTDTDLRETLRKNAALKELPMQDKAYEWFAKLPEANYAETDGGEMYLIIPRDSEAHVVITAVDPVQNKEYGRIYSSYNGAPVLLRCNQSEIASNVTIQITDNSGEHPAFSPYLSGKDGRPVTDSDHVKILNES